MRFMSPKIVEPGGIPMKKTKGCGGFFPARPQSHTLGDPGFGHDRDHR
jgi:hypothetical protein